MLGTVGAGSVVGSVVGVVTSVCCVAVGSVGGVATPSSVPSVVFRVLFVGVLVFAGASFWPLQAEKDRNRTTANSNVRLFFILFSSDEKHTIKAKCAKAGASVMAR